METVRAGEATSFLNFPEKGAEDSIFLKHFLDHELPEIPSFLDPLKPFLLEAKSKNNCFYLVLYVK